MKALIVDDSRVLRRHMRDILRAAGLETIEAGDGLQALGILHEDAEIDLALLDLNMPLMDGDECLRRLRKELPQRRVKVMMVTTEADPRVIRSLLAQGADEFLMKPFTLENIYDKLQLLRLEDAREDHAEPL